jgi:hypothetical protein
MFDSARTNINAKLELVFGDLRMDRFVGLLLNVDGSVIPHVVVLKFSSPRLCPEPTTFWSLTTTPTSWICSLGCLARKGSGSARRPTVAMRWTWWRARNSTRRSWTSQCLIWMASSWHTPSRERISGSRFILRCRKLFFAPELPITTRSSVNRSTPTNSCRPFESFVHPHEEVTLDCRPLLGAVRVVPASPDVRESIET